MAVAADGPRLTLYSRNYCHLCDEMIAGLRGLQAGFRFQLEVIDVDSDPALERNFGERVPVLMHDGQELCHYRLDAVVITALLSKIR
jgi:hypothetical protein